MSYYIYTTNGIILKRTPIGEANAYFHILTEDLGLIVASAQAVRKLSSKLRSSIQEYTMASVSCVKSKNGWKVTNVLEKGNFYFQASSVGKRLVAQIGSVLLKMIPGEAPHPEIYQTVQTGLSSLGGFANPYAGEADKVKVLNLEILMVLRILYQLGYVVSDENTKEFLENTTLWSNEVLNKTAINKRELVALINKALEASQL